MSHFARELSDAEWYLGRTAGLATVIRNIDEKTKKAISASGGTWNPSAPIIIGGAGIELLCNLHATSGAVVLPGVGKNYKFGDDDYFGWTSHPSRVVETSCLMAFGGTRLPREVLALALPTTTGTGIMIRRHGGHVMIPLRVHDGATFSGDCILKFGVFDTHAGGVPQNLPRARVIRINADGEITPLSWAGSYQPDGWVSPPLPASGAAWFNGGALQTLNVQVSGIPPLFDPVVVDISTYDYFLEFIDESGTNAWVEPGVSARGTALYSIDTTFTYSNLRAQ